jgi:hypothetical protein
MSNYVLHGGAYLLYIAEIGSAERDPARISNRQSGRLVVSAHEELSDNCLNIRPLIRRPAVCIYSLPVLLSFKCKNILPLHSLPPPEIPAPPPNIQLTREENEN